MHANDYSAGEKKVGAPWWTLLYDRRIEIKLYKISNKITWNSSIHREGRAASDQLGISVGYLPRQRTRRPQQPVQLAPLFPRLRRHLSFSHDMRHRHHRIFFGNRGVTESLTLVKRRGVLTRVATQGSWPDDRCFFSYWISIRQIDFLCNQILIKHSF